MIARDNGGVVSVIENRSIVEMQPLTPPEPVASDGWLTCQVMVSDSTDVPGYPNLLAADLPRRMRALLRRGELADFDGEGSWRAEASLVGPGQLRVERALN
jgi:hypothetical protein